MSIIGVRDCTEHAWKGKLGSGVRLSADEGDCKPSTRVQERGVPALNKEFQTIFQDSEAAPAGFSEADVIGQQILSRCGVRSVDDGPQVMD